MALELKSYLAAAHDQFRFKPTAKRVRGIVDGQTVVDSTRACLVWEPRRVVPEYAVPAADIAGVQPRLYRDGGSVGRGPALPHHPLHRPHHARSGRRPDSRQRYDARAGGPSAHRVDVILDGVPLKGPLHPVTLT